MIVYIEFAEYDLSYSPSSPMFFYIDSKVGSRRRDWTSGCEALENLVAFVANVKKIVILVNELFVIHCAGLFLHF
jgi:hypothetical protein